MAQYTGTPGNDNLIGSAAADVLDGGAGADTLSGLAGNDVYMVDDPGDVVIEDPGAGTDRINAVVSITLPANVEDLWLVGSATTSGTGNALDNVMWGNAAANVLSGLAGNDTIDGGAGADTLIGGTGDDTYWVDDPADSVTENAAEGNDTVKSTLPSYTLAANVENLLLLPGAGNLQGIGNALDNVLTGNEGANSLVGGAGNDTIDGGAGADAMAGGTGNDSFWVDDAGDTVAEASGDGTDTVTSSLAQYTLPANVENLNLGTFYGSTTALNGTGNGLDNTLRGNAGPNLLSGGGGNDMLVGGDGNDTLTGGSGNDVFYVSTTDSGTDTITDLTSGDVIEVCGATFSGAVTVGSGAAVGAGEVQLSTAGGLTTLHIGLDSSPGADLQIVLNGNHAASSFQPRGFDLVYDTNHAPLLNTALADQHGTENASFAFQLPANAFIDADGDLITYTLAVFDPDWGYVPLPAWLHFDALSGLISGTPTHADIGSSMLVVTATDALGARTDAVFNLAVQAAPPVVAPEPTPPAPQEVDTKAPLVTAMSPGNGAVDVAATTPLVWTFNEPVQRGSGSISLFTEDGRLVQTCDAATSTSFSIAGSKLSFHPAQDLAKGTAYVLTLSPGAVKDLAGNALAGATSQHFQTLANTAAGTAQSDHLAGSAGMDHISAGEGNDLLDGGTGDDQLDGGAGLDVAAFAATRAQASLHWTGRECIVSSPLDGSDHLTGIERLMFSDGNLALDLDGHAGDVARVIGALFGPEFLAHPDYVGIGLAAADRGLDLSGLVTMALSTEAFAHLAGSHSNTDFVNLVYRNVVGTAPTPADLAAYVGLLDSGSQSQLSLAVMACDTAANLTHIDLAGLASTGLAYTLFLQA